MKRIIGISFFSLLIALVHPCLASEDTLFDAIDANKDGSLTMKELAGQKLVIEIRTDGLKEVHQADAAHEGSAPVMTFEQKRNLFEAIDQDKNGSISRPEWDRASPSGFVVWRF